MTTENNEDRKNVFNKQLTAATPAGTVDADQTTKEELDRYNREFPAKPFAAALEAGLSNFRTKPTKINPIGGRTFERKGTLLILTKLSTMPTGAYKLFTWALIKLYSTADKEKWKDYHIIIPVMEYLKECGYEVEPKEDTAEARKAAHTALSNGLAYLDKSVRALNDVRINLDNYRNQEGKKNIRKRVWGTMVLFPTAIRVQDRHIFLTINPDIIEILKRAPLTRFPAKFLGTNDRKPNLQGIYLKLAQHAAIDANRKKGTNHSLRVSSILPFTGLPTIEELEEKGNRKHWKDRIQKPFEEAMHELVETGFLEDWYYQSGKGKWLEGDAATEFPSYTDWAEKLIYFKLCGDLDDGIALAQIKAREAERKKKLSAARKKAAAKKKAAATAK